MPNRMNKCDFSRLAAIYDLLGDIAFVGALRRSQNCFLKILPHSKRVLIIGGGSGRFLVDLLKSHEFDFVDYVDISPGMIEQAKKNVGRQLPHLKSKVNFTCGSVESVRGQTYDLICTHYILDCFAGDELKEVMNLLHDSLGNGGHWLFADFMGDNYIKECLIAFLYQFFKFTVSLKPHKLGDFVVEFRKLNLEICEEKYFVNRLIRAALYKKNEECRQS
ncbi:MAG: class I SAM-dependent methyltransferase [Lentisphaeraceae bacterium]|nr:class I SAM-dependent methyltransferase [Lentisphaeraceae bacterium]